MIKGLDNLVYLEPKEHRYFHRLTGVEYMPVSRFLNLFKEPFDPNLAYRCAGKNEYENMTPEQVKEHWKNYGKERSEEGTRIHNALELFSNTTEILSENNDLKPAILNIAYQYKDYYKQLNEIVLHDDDELIAGTSDKVFIVNSHKNSPIDIGDFKTNLGGIKQVNIDKHGKPVHKYLLHCLSHMIDSKYNFYCLQLSDYAYKIEKQTGRKVRKLFIHYINPENPLINYQIPVPYLKYEIIQMLEWRRKSAIPIENPFSYQNSNNDDFDIM